MDVDFIINLGRQILSVMVLISSPMLITALVVGFVISLFQAATQINEMTLSFIPKLLAIIASILLFGTWGIELLMHFTIDLWSQIPEVIRTK